MNKLWVLHTLYHDGDGDIVGVYDTEEQAEAEVEEKKYDCLGLVLIKEVILNTPGARREG